jgi:tetratricopeptide (TPR) repeat protein
MRSFVEFKTLKEAEEYFTPFLSKDESPEVRAEAFNSLAAMNRFHGSLDESEKLQREAINILRGYTVDDNEWFVQCLGKTLTNLGNILEDQDRDKEAMAAYNEGLKIRRELAEMDPEYLPDVADSLHFIGSLQMGLDEYDKAEETFTEELQITAELAYEDPDEYNKDLAKALHDLGAVNWLNEIFSEAVAMYGKALAIYRELAKNDPLRYLPKVALELYSVGYAEMEIRNPEEVVPLFEESLEIRRMLVEADPKDNYFSLVELLSFLSMFYLAHVPNKELSIQYAKEALEVINIMPDKRHVFTCQIMIESVMNSWEELRKNY